MRIVWNNIERRFEAQLESGANWRADQEAAQLAGFKCAGPPEWVWWTAKAMILNGLRTKFRPPNLTIQQPETLQQYNVMMEKEAANAAIVALGKQLKKQNAKVKCLEDQVGGDSDYWIPEENRWHIAEPSDSSPVIGQMLHRDPFVPAKWPGPFCQVCNDPCYIFEQQDPPLCMFCEKTIQPSEKIMLDAPVQSCDTSGGNYDQQAQSN